MNDLIDWMPEPAQPWIWAGVVIFLAVAAAVVIHAALYDIARRVTRRTDAVADSSAVRRTRNSARLVFALMAIRLAEPVLPLSETGHDTVRHLIGVDIRAKRWISQHAKINH